LLIALRTPSAASAVTAKYQVPEASPVMVYLVVVEPLTTTEYVREPADVP
jgi:hypothetical protein